MTQNELKLIKTLLCIILLIHTLGCSDAFQSALAYSPTVQEHPDNINYTLPPIEFCRDNLAVGFYFHFNEAFYLNVSNSCIVSISCDGEIQLGQVLQLYQEQEPQVVLDFPERLDCMAGQQFFCKEDIPEWLFCSYADGLGTYFSFLLQRY